MSTQYTNTHLMYFSPTGTTASVVNAVGSAFGTTTTLHDLTLTRGSYTNTSFGPKDLLVLGMPVYAGRIPAYIRPALDSIQGDDTPAVILAVYGNRDIDDALVEMQDILSEKGFHTVAGAAFIGEHSFTAKVATARPDSEDLAKATAFGTSVAELLADKEAADLSLTLRGNRPYKELKPAPPLGPTISEQCSSCGSCINTCPTGALSPGEITQVNPELCILCHKCYRVCPSNCIDFEDRIPAIRQRLIDNFSTPLSPEFFFGS